MINRWLTVTKLARVLKHSRGCLRAKAHARAMIEAGQVMRCYVAHPPTLDDEVADQQSWFPRIKKGGRKSRKSWALAGGRWNPMNNNGTRIKRAKVNEDPQPFQSRVDPTPMSAKPRKRRNMKVERPTRAETAEKFTDVIEEASILKHGYSVFDPEIE